MDSLGGLAGQFWSTLIGAVVGAAVGGLISYLIQRSGIKASREERLAIKRQEDLAIAFSTMVKLITIMSNFKQIKEALDHAVSELAPNTQGPMWLAIQPFATIPPHVEFTKEESAFIFSTKISNIMLAALELSNVYNDTRQLIERYGEKREALSAMIPVDSVTGNLAASCLDEVTLKTLIPLIVPVEMLADEMLNRRGRNFDGSVQTYDTLRKYCEKYFGGDFPKLELIDA
jgi:hypothetical protein